MALVTYADHLRVKGRIDESLAACKSAIQLEPTWAPAFNSLGIGLLDKGWTDPAIVALRKAVELDPTFPHAYNNLGNALTRKGLTDEALEIYNKAIELRPNAAIVYNNMGSLLKDKGRIPEAIAAFREAGRLHSTFQTAHSNMLYTLYFDPAYDAQRIYQEHVAWAEAHAAPLISAIQPCHNDPSPNRRLRIGYVSPSFRNHCQAHFILPVLKSHNREEVDTLCYVDVRHHDDYTREVISLADTWRNIVGMSDEAVAQMIRDDHIDILIDLTMHMAGGRPLLFARKPAPIQVAWLAYPGTSGLTSIDYHITDPYLDPDPLEEGVYSEKALVLPRSFWCYDPRAETPHVSQLPMLQNNYVTFSSFNNFCKVNRDVLEVWAVILHQVTNSRLHILSAEGNHRRELLDVMMDLGIAEERITFFTLRPRNRYLELYRDCDIGLDTFPYTGHTTTIDAVWMGVPVVTMPGSTACSRGATSILKIIGVPELVARDAEEYIAIARNLAGDAATLSTLRASLRNRMRRSPIMDFAGFTADLEAAYRKIWREWCADEQHKLSAVSSQQSATR